jgi:hypothetical protein
MVNLQEFLDQHEYTVLNRMNRIITLNDPNNPNNPGNNPGNNNFIINSPGGWGSEEGDIFEFIIKNLNYFSLHFDLGDHGYEKIGKGSFNTLIKTNIKIKGQSEQKDVAIRINSKPTLLIDTEKIKDNNYELLFTMGAYKSDFGAPIYEIFQVRYLEKFVQVIIMKLYTSDVKTLLAYQYQDKEGIMLMNVINTVNDIIIFMINNFDMLCLDIKFENFVAEYDVAEYDVKDIKDIKMIDFGADFCSNLGNNSIKRDKDIYIILSTLLLYISAVSIYTVKKKTYLKLRGDERLIVMGTNNNYLTRINTIFKGPLDKINENKTYIDTAIKGSKFRDDILKVLNHYYAYINNNFNTGSNSIEELIDNINRRFVNKFNNNSNFGYANIATGVITYPSYVGEQPSKPPVNNMKTFDSISKDLLKQIPNFNKKYTYKPITNVNDMFTDFYKSIENIKVTNKFGKSRKSTKRRKSRKSTKRRKSRKSTKRRKSRKSTKRRKSRKSTKRRKSN